MKIRSVRLSQGVFLVSVISLVVLSFLYIYFGKIIGAADARYQVIVQMQKSFADLVLLERRVMDDNELYGELVQHRLELIERVENDREQLSPVYLAEREHAFATLLKTSAENQQQYIDIRRTLPRLIDNVRYIHSYHITKLKAAIKKGELIPQTDDAQEFTRSEGAAVPELDIINAALEVHNKLMDVISVFYELQMEGSLNDITHIFHSRMDDLHEAVNRFDDYSFDAQDGLLVEELLLTGNKFRVAFGLLLKNSQKIGLLEEKLTANQQQISSMFNDAAGPLHKTKEVLKQRLNIIQNISVGVLLLLACWLIYYGVRLSRAFIRTVSETKKIGNDLTYRIPLDTKSYQEFETIYSTLNALAETASNQVKSLEKMQRELGHRVQERTAELVHMNTRLKNEIADRIKADDFRRQLEDRLIRAKKMEAVGTLAGGVAHDLNNILSGVVTYPELLLMDMKESDPMYQPLHNIKLSGERAANIVQDLLTLARRGVAVSEVVDFKELVIEYLASPEFENVKKSYPGVRVDVRLEEDLGNIKGSRLHLQKAIMNIVTNGLEAMAEGGILSIESRAVCIDTKHKGYETVREGDYICFSVTDTGIGMTREVAEQIFEPFFTRKQMGRRSGTGLGMAVVYSTIKDHGGYIDVHSEVDQGTSISFYLPLSREKRSDINKNLDLNMLTGNGEHLLVVDDVFEQRQIASAILKRLNYTVATAASGEEAVAYIRDNEVDLVILDMIMPDGMDGFDTFMAMKAVSPDIRVIIASGYSESDRVQRAQSLGAGKYIRKPYSLESLGRAIRDSLG